MGNFSFVEHAWPAIAQCGQQAEECASAAPEACLLRLRQLVEAGVAVLLGPERPRELYLAIEALGPRLGVPRPVLVDLHRLRKLGSRAAHQEPGTGLDDDEALLALGLAHRAVGNLAVQLLVPPPAVPPFHAPVARLDAALLATHLAALEARLQAQEAAAAAREIAWSIELTDLFAARSAAVDLELSRRRERLTRRLAADLEVQRNSRQLGLFAAAGPSLLEVEATRLAALELELAQARAERLAVVERELAVRRERYEREALTITAPPAAPPALPAAPWAHARVARGLPGPELAWGLWERFQGWVVEGIPSDRILVLLESPTRSAWTGLLKGEPPEHIAPSQRPAMPTEGLAVATGAERVHTPLSWMREELTRWWPVVEERLVAAGLPAVRPVAGPLFVEVTLAQHLMERFSGDLRAGEEGLLANARTARPMQNVQMLDALARALEHGATLLGPDGPPCEALAGAVARRLLEGAEPAAGVRRLIEEERLILVRYLEGMLAHRLFDFALAMDLFMGALWPDPRYRAHLLATTTHVLVENLDEAPPRLLACWQELCELGLTFCATLQQDDPEAPVAEPFQGGLREYVGADPQGARELAARMDSEAPELPAPPFLGLGRALHDALLGARRPLATLPAGLQVRLEHVTFPELLSAVGAELARLLTTVPPAEIALVVPTLDPLIIWSIRRQVAQLGHALYVFAGTNRLTDYRPARLLVTLARLVYRDWELPPAEFELHELLEHVTGLDPLRLAKLSGRLIAGAELAPPMTLHLLEEGLSPEVHGRYERFHAWLGQAREAPLADFSLFFRDAFARMYAPFALGPEVGVPTEALQRDISQIGQLIEVAAEFLVVDRRCDPADEPGRGRRFLEHLGGSPILERPFYKREPRRDAIMLSTANQLAERGYRAPGETLRHLFVLDVGSERWWKPDHKELVNPRVLSVRWPGGRFTHADGQRLMDAKLARVLFAACLKPTVGLHLHGCLVDAEGHENLGELPALLEAVLGGREPAREPGS